MQSEAMNTQGVAAHDSVPAAVPDVVVSCVADATGAESPATPMEVTLLPHTPDAPGSPPLIRQETIILTVAQLQIEQRRERHGRRKVYSELRDRLVTAMMEQLQRVTGDSDIRHLRLCASRYESFVWKKSANQVQYKQKLEHRIESLRRQPSHEDNHGVVITVRLVDGHRLNLIRSSDPTLVTCPYRRYPVQEQRAQSSHLQSSSKRVGKRKNALTTLLLDTASLRRDEMYFEKLRAMKTQYRDEVALVFRELCRVNTVIQHSTSLRRHDSNYLGDFLASLKKIICLLEQQPGEVGGMIPARKRTVEYLDVVESHIQRKVLPILHRLRRTYSTILRPIVLNYMKNSFFNRRF